MGKFSKYHQYVYFDDDGALVCKLKDEYFAGGTSYTNTITTKGNSYKTIIGKSTEIHQRTDTRVIFLLGDGLEVVYTHIY